MSTYRSRNIFSIFFFSIFFVKMCISALPLCSDSYGKQTILSVIMQLEIENQNNNSGSGETVKDIFSKYLTKSSTPDIFVIPTRFLAFLNYIPDDARDIRAFYPSVPTPPPNC